MATDPPVPIVLAIDVESDARDNLPGRGVEVLGLRRSLAALTALRPRFEDATGSAVRFAWFVRMDPQIAAQGGRPDALLECAPEAVAAIEEAGDVIGLHTHAGRWDAARLGWIADHADPAWVDTCLVSSAAAFEARFGRACREHRFGDRFSSPAVFDRLADLGVRVDLTPEPGQRGGRRPPHVRLAEGRIPAYLRTPRTPYPVGDGRLWILPLSSADPAPAMGWHRRWMRRVRYVGEPRHRTLVLDRAWPSPEMFWELAEAQLEEGPTHLAFVFRSDLILQPRWPGTAALLEALLRRPLVQRLAFVGGEEAVARSRATPPVPPELASPPARRHLPPAQRR